MNKETRNDDVLRSMFRQLPEAELPPSFRDDMMKRVVEEAARVKKRNERLSLLAVILASAGMLALAVLAFIHLDIPRIDVRVPDLSAVPFYIYIGILSFLLLLGDYLMRKNYRERHKKH